MRYLLEIAVTMFKSLCKGFKGLWKDLNDANRAGHDLDSLDHVVMVTLEQFAYCDLSG